MHCTRYYAHALLGNLTKSAERPSYRSWAAQLRSRCMNRIKPQPQEYCPTPEALFGQVDFTIAYETACHQRLAASVLEDTGRIRPHEKKKK